MDGSPLVSLCIPTYNAGEFFEPCLQSALAQTHPNLEVLISDDGSTDDTLAIAERYRQRHPQIRIVKNASPGMVNNWNHCIAQAKGEWVKFLFQDDLLEPACVQKLLEACLRCGVDVGFCRRRFIIHEGVPPRIRHDFKYRMVLPERIFEGTPCIAPQQLAAELADVLPDNALGEPTVYFFNKRIFAHTGTFDADFRQVVDMEFLLRLGLLKGLAFVAEPLAWFRVHGGSATSANVRNDKDAQLRSIASIEGDKILLFYKFLTDPAFRLVKEIMGEDLLRLKMNYLYQSGCKKKGAGLFNRALAPVRSKYKEIGDMKYGFFRYRHYRKRHRQWERENRW